jgi:hypothetical protein
MVDEIQIEIFKNMTPEEKLKVAERLYWSAFELRYAAFKTQFPELSDKEINEKTVKYFIRAE